MEDEGTLCRKKELHPFRQEKIKRNRTKSRKRSLVVKQLEKRDWSHPTHTKPTCRPILGGGENSSVGGKGTGIKVEQVCKTAWSNFVKGMKSPARSSSKEG